MKTMLFSDCTNTTELSGHVGRSMPMVVNPIYEAGAIYEEIPDSIRFKPLPPQPHAPGAEKEEGYVSISSVTPANKAGSKSDLVSVMIPSRVSSSGVACCQSQS